MPDVLVGRQEYVKAGFLRHSQEFTVAERVPAQVFRLLDRMILRNERRGVGVPWSKRMSI